MIVIAYISISNSIVIDLGFICESCKSVNGELFDCE